MYGYDPEGFKGVKILITPSEGSKGDRKALGRSDRSEIVSKQLLFIFPGVARKTEKSFL